MTINESAWMLFEKSSEHVLRSEYLPALDLLGEALREFKLSQDSQGETRALLMLASINNELGNFTEAAGYHTEGLLAARRLEPNNIFTALHLDGIGVAYGNIGRWKEAIEYFEQAIQESRKPVVKMRRLRATILQHLANVYVRYSDRYLHAIELYDEAISISNDFNDRLNVGLCLTFKGVAFEAQGKLEAALQSHEKAKQIAEALPDDGLLSTCYAQLANIYDHLQQLTLAQKYAQQALMLDTKLGNKQGMNRDYLILGKLCRREGDKEGALQAFQSGFLLARGIRDIKNVLMFMEELGGIYTNAQQGGKAEKYYQEALTLCREVGDTRSEVRVRMKLADLQNYSEALNTVNEALQIADAQGYRDLRMLGEVSLARMYADIDDYDRASSLYTRAALHLEEMRTSFQVEEHIRAFAELYSEIYEALVDIDILTGATNDAFDFAERSRSRVLSSVMHRRQVKSFLAAQGVQSTEYEEICSEIIRLELEIKHAESSLEGTVDGLKKQLESAVLQETELLLTARRSTTQKQEFEHFGVVKLADLQEQLGQLRQEVVVLNYYTTKKDAYVFVVGKDHFAVHTLGVPVDTLRRLIYEFRQSLGVTEGAARDVVLMTKPASPTVSATYIAQSQRLFELLISPVYEAFQKADHICVIPHGPLHYLPFHALHDGQKYLIEYKSISYAPSITVLSLSFTQDSVRPQTVLALGDPESDLPPLGFAREEVLAIEQVIGTARCRSAIGADATKDMLLEVANSARREQDFDIWHLATHAVFIQSAPHLSFLQLASAKAGEGRIHAFELAGLQHSARLVIASACHTALTLETGGDELNGLLYSLMAVDSKSVIASLWAVNDRSTAELMRVFYENLLGDDPISLATALQTAQLALLRSPETAAPYFWSPFVLHGNWYSVPTEMKSHPAFVEPNPQMYETQARAHFYKGESCLSRAKLAADANPFIFLSREVREELETGISEFSEAIRLHPGYQVAYRQRGITHYRLSRYTEALDDLRHAIALNDRESLSFAALGILLSRNEGESLQAIDALEQAFRLDPRVQITSWEINTHRLSNTLERLKAEQAVQQCTRMLTSSAPTADLYARRGYAYQRLSYVSDDHRGNKQHAINDYETALGLDPQYIYAKFQLAVITYSNNEAGGIEAYSAIITSDPENAEAHCRLADIYLYQKQLDQAVNEYQEALRLNPAVAHAYCSLGQAYLNKGEWEKAVEAYENETRREPNCFDAHLYLNAIYAAQGRAEAAQAEYVECLRTTSHHLYEGELGVGLSQEIVNWIMELARRKKAQQPQGKAVSQAVIQSYLTRANDLTTQRKLREAIALYTELLEIDPHHPLAFAYRAGCYGDLGDYEQAVSDCQKAIDLDDSCAVAYFNLYALYQGHWEVDKARLALDRALMLDPELAQRLKSQNDDEKTSDERVAQTLDEKINEAYESSRLRCAFCDKPLRKPLGARVIATGKQLTDLMKDIPYYCTNCHTVSCFDCCAETKLSKVICRKCGSEMKAWGQTDAP